MSKSYHEQLSSMNQKLEELNKNNFLMELKNKDIEDRNKSQEKQLELNTKEIESLKSQNKTLDIINKTLKNVIADLQNQDLANQASNKNLNNSIEKLKYETNIICLDNTSKNNKIENLLLDIKQKEAYYNEIIYTKDDKIVQMNSELEKKHMELINSNKNFQFEKSLLESKLNDLKKRNEHFECILKKQNLSKDTSRTIDNKQEIENWLGRNNNNRKITNYRNEELFDKSYLELSDYGIHNENKELKKELFNSYSKYEDLSKKYSVLLDEKNILTKEIEELCNKNFISTDTTSLIKHLRLTNLNLLYNNTLGSSGIQYIHKFSENNKLDFSNYEELENCFYSLYCRQEELFKTVVDVRDKNDKLLEKDIQYQNDIKSNMTSNQDIAHTIKESNIPLDNTFDNNCRKCQIIQNDMESKLSIINILEEKLKLIKGELKIMSNYNLELESSLITEKNYYKAYNSNAEQISDFTHKTYSNDLVTNIEPKLIEIIHSYNIHISNFMILLSNLEQSIEFMNSKNKSNLQTIESHIIEKKDLFYNSTSNTSQRLFYQIFNMKKELLSYQEENLNLKHEIVVLQSKLNNNILNKFDIQNSISIELKCNKIAENSLPKLQDKTNESEFISEEKYKLKQDNIISNYNTAIDYNENSHYLNRVNLLNQLTDNLKKENLAFKFLLKREKKLRTDFISSLCEIPKENQKLLIENENFKLILNENQSLVREYLTNIENLNTEISQKNLEIDKLKRNVKELENESNQFLCQADLKTKELNEKHNKCLKQFCKFIIKSKKIIDFFNVYVKSLNSENSKIIEDNSKLKSQLEDIVNKYTDNKKSFSLQESEIRLCFNKMLKFLRQSNEIITYCYKLDLNNSPYNNCIENSFLKQEIKFHITSLKKFLVRDQKEDFEFDDKILMQKLLVFMSKAVRITSYLRELNTN